MFIHVYDAYDRNTKRMACGIIGRFMYSDEEGKEKLVYFNKENNEEIKDGHLKYFIKKNQRRLIFISDGNQK